MLAAHLIANVVVPMGTVERLVTIVEADVKGALAAVSNQLSCSCFGISVVPGYFKYYCSPIVVAGHAFSLTDRST